MYSIIQKGKLCMAHYTSLNVYDENLNYLWHFLPHALLNSMTVFILSSLSEVCIEEFLCKVDISKPLQIKSLKILILH